MVGSGIEILTRLAKGQFPRLVNGYPIDQRSLEAVVVDEALILSRRNSVCGCNMTLSSTLAVELSLSDDQGCIYTAIDCHIRSVAYTMC